MNEHDYFRNLIMERFNYEVTAKVNPLHDEHKFMLLQHNYSEADKLEKLRDQVLQELYIKRARAEEIINWLQLDSQLRHENTTYPDVRETKL